MTVSRLVLFFSLSFIFGIAVSSFFNVSRSLLPGFFIAALILLTATALRRKKPLFFGFCLLFFVLGAWRHQSAFFRLPQISEGEASFIGIVVKEPKIGEKSTQLTVGTDSGKVLITTWRYPKYYYGDKLAVSGKLEEPSEDLSGFNYRDYLKKDGIFSVMAWPKIEALESGLGNPLTSLLISFKNKFKESARLFVSPPQVSILEALIFGDEGGISKVWQEKLNHTGTRHIVAVSGMNITIIVSLVMSFLLLLGLWRRHAFYFSVILLILYVLMLGFPASATRAGIMALILLFGRYLGRLGQAKRAVVFAASSMLFLNPLLLKSDVGFQLSFLAVMGIIYLEPVWSKLLKRAPDYKFFPVRTTLSTTLSAQVFTFPILIYNFGYVSLVSPLTNILIVPLLAPLTVLLFVFGIASMIFWPLGYVLSWPAWFLLTYITLIIDFFSKF